MGQIQVTKVERRLEAVQCAASREATIYLYGYIDDSSGWFSDDEIITPQNVREAMDGIDADLVRVHINSPGGSGVAAVAIYNYLTQHKAKIHVYVDGMAASGGSIIAMAGEKIFMPANTFMLIHHAWMIAIGDAAQLRKNADDLDKVEAIVYETYKAHFVGTDEELKVLLDEESPLSADECLAFGFCTDVIPLKPAEDTAKPQALSKSVLLTKYRKDKPPESKPESMKISAAKVMAAFFESLNRPSK